MSALRCRFQVPLAALEVESTFTTVSGMYKCPLSCHLRGSKWVLLGILRHTVVCNNVQQASQRHAPTSPLRRETYERKRRMLGADCKRPA